MIQRSPRTVGWVINGACAGVVGLTGAALALLWTDRVAFVPPDTLVAAARPTPVETQAPDPAVLWKRDLRQVLIEKPRPASPADPKPPPLPPPPIRLVGTAVEGVARFGIFDCPGTGPTLRQVGEELDGYQIQSIEPRRAVLRRGTQDFELALPAESVPAGLFGP